MYLLLWCWFLRGATQAGRKERRVKSFPEGTLWVAGKLFIAERARLKSAREEETRARRRLKHQAGTNPWGRSAATQGLRLNGSPFHAMARRKAGHLAKGRQAALRSMAG